MPAWLTSPALKDWNMKTTNAGKPKSRASKVKCVESAGSWIQGNHWIQLGLSRDQVRLITRLGKDYRFKEKPCAHMARQLIMMALINLPLIERSWNSTLKYCQAEDINVDHFLRDRAREVLNEVMSSQATDSVAVQTSEAFPQDPGDDTRSAAIGYPLPSESGDFIPESTHARRRQSRGSKKRKFPGMMVRMAESKIEELRACAEATGLNLRDMVYYGLIVGLPMETERVLGVSSRELVRMGKDARLRLGRMYRSVRYLTLSKGERN
jgi:hypothetical protein